MQFIDPKYKLHVMLLYGSGLRVMECVRLRVQDIDYDYGAIRIWQGKGGKIERWHWLRSSTRCSKSKKHWHDDIIRKIWSHPVMRACGWWTRYRKTPRRWVWVQLALPVSINQAFHRSWNRLTTPATYQRSRFTACGAKNCCRRWHHKEHHLPHLAAQFCNSLTWIRRWHSYRARAVRTLRCQNDAYSLT